MFFYDKEENKIYLNNFIFSFGDEENKIQNSFDDIEYNISLST